MMRKLRRRTWADAVVCLVACLTLWQAAWPQTGRKPANNPPSALQRAVTRALAGRSGAVVVLDVTSGEILAAYHPEVAAQRLAAPGSSIKPFTLLALLEAGRVDAQTTLLCRRPLTIGGHKLDCTHPEMQQPFDPATALAYSCNSYFTTVATRLLPAELRNSLLKYGFGSPSELASKETTGSVALAGTQTQLQLEAIGEWGIRVTPLELLHGYRMLALLSPKHDAKSASLFAGLEGATSYGMGRMAQPDSAMKVAGKTGTSLAEEGPWRHGWFAGYTPADQPKIALVVFLEKGNGPIDAAGVAREIFEAYARVRRSDSPLGNGR